MLGLELDRDLGVLVIEPDGPLSTADFDQLAALLDPYLETAGRLGGLMVDTRGFPGWDGFGALLAHERFLRGHAPKIDRVALVSDSEIFGLLAPLAALALAPKIRRFPWDARAAAMAWLTAAPLGDRAAPE